VTWRRGAIIVLALVVVAAITITTSTELSSPPTNHPKGTPWPSTHT